MAFKQAQLGLAVTEIVNITASHNRFDYVGIKLSDSEGEPESDCTYERIEQIVEEIENKEDIDCFRNSHLSLLAHDQQIEIGDYLDYESSYIKKLRDNFNLPKLIKNHFKIAVDYSYGNAIGYVEKIFANAPIQILSIHKAGLVGKNFDPDTEKENLVSLMDLVKREHCDFGICLDTDGNKISFIDENGDYINTDTVLALLVEDLIRKNKKHGSIILTLPTTRLIEKIALVNGISKDKIIYSDVGFKYVVEQMRNHPDYIFAFEEYGGGTVKDWIHDSDVFYLAIMIVIQLQKESKSLSKCVANLYGEYGHFKKYSKNIVCENPLAVFNSYVKALNLHSIIRRFGGLSVIYRQIPYIFFLSTQSLWLAIRPSGTENRLRITLEITYVTIINNE